MANGKYKEWLKKDKLKRLEHMARNGARDIDIAKKIGISKVTLYEWKKRFPEFAEALKKGKDEYDDDDLIANDDERLDDDDMDDDDIEDSDYEDD